MVAGSTILLAVVAGGAAISSIIALCACYFALRRRRSEDLRASRERGKAAASAAAPAPGMNGRMRDEYGTSHAPAGNTIVPPARLPAPGDYADGDDGRRTHGRPSAEVDDEARWEWPSSSLTWGKRLGKGSFGSVLAVESAGLRLAAKRIQYDEREREATLRIARREALAMRRLAHPNVVQILGVILDHPGYVALLMERADYGSLRDALDDHGALVAAKADVQLRLALHIAEGMAYLHAREPPMLHHDLKSANVLLFAGPGGAQTARGPPQLDEGSVRHLQAKLCDFGLASGLGTSHGATALQSTRTNGAGGGTLAYSAPEAFSDEYVLASEVYSYAIILWEVITSKIPWVTNPANGKPYTQATLMHAVLSGKRPELPDGLANSVLGGLAQRCWQGSAAARPSFEMVRRHLQLGLRQSMSDLGHTDGPTADYGDEDYGEDSDEGVAGANDRKLMRTLKLDIHRSHKHNDAYNDVMKTRAGRLTTRKPERCGAPPPASPMPMGHSLANRPSPALPMPSMLPPPGATPPSRLSLAERAEMAAQAAAAEETAPDNAPAEAAAFTPKKVAPVPLLALNTPAQSLGGPAATGRFSSRPSARPPTLRVPITPEHAADNKLMHTLRHNVHRSHKHSDEFNGVHRSRVGRVTSRSSAPVEAPSPARDGAPPPASPMVQMI